jgi:hypothetical protein
MTWPWLAALAAVLLVAFLAAMWRVGAAARDPRRALAAFQRHRDELRAAFFLSASTSGKPRGLVWKSIDWHDGGVTLVRERDTRRLAALVGVTIAFEAVAGGEMEGVAAVGNLRHGSAAFFYHSGTWQTTGKVIFNLLPEEVVARFAAQYEPVAQAASL